VAVPDWSRDDYNLAGGATLAGGGLEMSNGSGRPKWSTRAAPQAQAAPREEEPKRAEVEATTAPGAVRAAGPALGVAGHDLRHELQTVIETRRELGPEYDTLVVEEFLERLDRTLDQRIAAEIARRPLPVPRDQPRFTKEMIGGLAATLALGIPLTSIGAEKAGPLGLLAVWVGIAVIWLGILGYLPRPRQ
jgi:hypothetical protein